MVQRYVAHAKEKKKKGKVQRAATRTTKATVNRSLDERRKRSDMIILSQEE